MPTLEPDLGHASVGKQAHDIETPYAGIPCEAFLFMRTVIIANGEPPTKNDISRWLRESDAIICADGGARAALALGLQPNHVIGDFDSLYDDEVTELERCGAQLHRHPTRKDETDLELALLFAVRASATENTENTEITYESSVLSVSSVAESIVVLGAMGGRLDHELANMLLLAMPALKGLRVIIAHGCERMFLIDARDEPCNAALDAATGDTVSLLPFGGDAHGITTNGLEYPLRDESLFVGPARGVSNVIVAQDASVALTQGMLLCVITTMDDGRWMIDD
jgi:thiamine pyrophosphokinase